MSLRDDGFDPTDLEAEGIPELEDAPPGLEDDYNRVEGMMPPRDHPVAADDWGVTPEEERLGEPFAERVRREEPDVLAGAADELHGRLLEPDQGVAGRDEERDPVASETGDDDALSAEEAAVHITDTP